MMTNRRGFIGGLAASLACAGCRTTPWWFGAMPNLKMGVISDIHLSTRESTDDLRRALCYFRDERVDAVMIAGDLSDWGLRSGWLLLAEVWNDVFPNDCAPDGRKVAKLFVSGNHDFDGWWYGDMTLDMHVQGYSEKEALTRLGVAKCWEEAFHEPYADIRKRTVKGYTFVSSEWHVNDKEEGDEAVAAWLDAHADELKGDKPFFFFRHTPVPCTAVSSSNKPSPLTAALARFPNAIAFNGHTHWTINDERAIWQGAFTALTIPSMSYTGVPSGYDNGYGTRNATSKLGMEILPVRENLEEAQGYLVSVYDDRMEVVRRDFEQGVEAAAPWVVPLGPNRDKPYGFARHAATTPVPQFPEGAALKAYVTNKETRNARWTIFMTLEFPAALASEGRIFDYEVRLEAVEDGATRGIKRYLSPSFHKLRRDEPNVVKLRYDAMDLPEKGAYRFAVYPRNCFGAMGKPIVSRVFESQPGKATPQR